MKRQKLLWNAASVAAVLGMALSRVSGMRFGAGLVWCAALVLIAYALLLRAEETKPAAKTLRRVLTLLLAAGCAVFAVLEGMVLRGARTRECAREAQCLIVLGAGVNGTQPSLMLKSRLDAALSFLEDKPDIPVIVTRGMGSGEEITEAECMARYLTARGIAPERILRETEATSTRENFAFSRVLMEQHGLGDAPFAFVTNDYHICRAGLLAGDGCGVAATLPGGAYYTALQVNYYIREAFALAKDLLLGG